MTLSIRRERRQPFLVSELQLRIPDLPEAFEGYRIVQLSDLHFGRTGRRLVEQAVAITNDLRPDLIALTGDYLEYTRQTVRKSVLPLRVTREDSRQHVFAVRALAAELGEILAELRSVDGVVAVHGNHEFIEGVRRIRARLPQQIRWLVNSSVALRRGEHSLIIAGIDDVRRGKPSITSSIETFAHTSQQHHPAAARIFLSHNPDFVLLDDAKRLGDFDLALCGHTHGGQLCLPFTRPLVTRTKQKRHIRGLAYEERLPIYVSHGVGFQGLPLRFNCPAEIVVVRLSRGAIVP